MLTYKHQALSEDCGAHAMEYIAGAPGNLKTINYLIN